MLKQGLYRHHYTLSVHMQGLNMPCSSPKRHASKNNSKQANTDHYQARTDTTRLVTGLITQTLTQGPYKTLLNSHARQITARTQTILSLYIHIWFCSIQTTAIHKNTDMQPKPFQETTLKTLLDTIQARNWKNLEFSGRRSIAGVWPESSDTTLFVRFLCRILFYTFPVVYTSNLSFE